MRSGRVWWIAGVTAMLAGLAPLAVALLAGTIASAHGCRLDEGDYHPCLIGGHDWGAPLYVAGVAGWLELLTIWLVPIGVVLLAVGLIRRFVGRGR